MGLRKVVQSDLTFYIYSHALNCTEGSEVQLVILEKSNSFTLKLSTSDDSVMKWSHNIQKAPKEYLSLLNKAAASSFTIADEEKDEEDIFEIQGDNLVWKQYFPDSKVYGKRGKFKLETVEYEDAVGKVLDGVMKDLNSNSKFIQNLKQESQEKSSKLNEAMELASRSILVKEEFEREIYSKCAAVINAKKLRIQQLKSSHPTSSVGKPCGLIRSAETPGKVTQLPKKPRLENSDSDCYNSDTDVDEPDEQDVDTDEENLVHPSPSKEKHETNLGVSTALKARIPALVSDSQELFDDSLEAELYPSSSAGMKQKISSKTPVLSKNGTHASQKMKTNKGETSESSSSTSSHKGGKSVTTSVPYDDSQKSIIDELF